MARTWPRSVNKILEMTKLLVEKPRKCKEEQVNIGRCEVEYEVDKKMLGECG